MYQRSELCVERGATVAPRPVQAAANSVCLLASGCLPQTSLVITCPILQTLQVAEGEKRRQTPDFLLLHLASSLERCRKKSLCFFSHQPSNKTPQRGGEISQTSFLSPPLSLSVPDSQPPAPRPCPSLPFLVVLRTMSKERRRCREKLISVSTKAFSHWTQAVHRAQLSTPPLFCFPTLNK